LLHPVYLTADGFCYAQVALGAAERGVSRSQLLFSSVVLRACRGQFHRWCE